MEIHEHTNINFLAELERTEPVLQDHSSVIVAMNCMRKYFYRIVLGRVPSGSTHQLILDFGSAYHKFRELLETHDFKTAIGYVMSDAKLATVDPAYKYSYLTRERLIKTCMVAYEYVQNERKQGKIEVISVEQPFNVELAPGIFIGGRADQIVKWNGKVWGRDFKTSTKDINTFQKGVNPNDQFTRYTVGESALHGQQIEGILVELMQNLKTQSPKISTIPVQRTQTQLKEWTREQIWFNDNVLKNARKDDVWMQQPHNCSWCDYRIVCAQPNERAMIYKLKTEYKYQPWDATKVNQEGE